jgi:hypothetical protein
MALDGKRPLAGRFQALAFITPRQSEDPHRGRSGARAAARPFLFYQVY